MMSDQLWAAEQGLANEAEAESRGLVALGQSDLSSIGAACQDCGFPKSVRQFEYISALQAALKDAANLPDRGADNALKLRSLHSPASDIEGIAWHPGCVAACSVTATRQEAGSFAWRLTVTVNGHEVLQEHFEGISPSGASGGLVPAVALLPTSMVSVVSCAVIDYETLDA